MGLISGLYCTNYHHNVLKDGEKPRKPLVHPPISKGHNSGQNRGNNRVKHKTLSVTLLPESHIPFFSVIPVSLRMARKTRKPLVGQKGRELTIGRAFTKFVFVQHLCQKVKNEVSRKHKKTSIKIAIRFYLRIFIQYKRNPEQILHVLRAFSDHSIAIHRESSFKPKFI